MPGTTQLTGKDISYRINRAEATVAAYVSVGSEPGTARVLSNFWNLPRLLNLLPRPHHRRWSRCRRRRR